MTTITTTWLPTGSESTKQFDNMEDAKGYFDAFCEHHDLYPDGENEAEDHEWRITLK